MSDNQNSINNLINEKDEIPVSINRENRSRIKPKKKRKEKHSNIIKNIRKKVLKLFYDIRLSFMRFKEDKKIRRQFFREIFAIILSIASYILYYMSLGGCEKTQTECLFNSEINYFYSLVDYCIISAALASFVVTLSIDKSVSRFHLIHIIGVFIYFFIYDHGSTLLHHGTYNIIGFIIFFLLISVLLEIGSFLYFCLWKRQLIVRLILGNAFIIFVIAIRIKYLSHLKLQCANWDIGLNQAKMDDNALKYGCKIRRPDICHIDLFSNVFDLSTILHFDCLNNEYFHKWLKPRKELLKYVNESEFNQTLRFGYPITTWSKYAVTPSTNPHEFGDLILSNMIDLDKVGYLLPDKYYPEVIVEFTSPEEYRERKVLEEKERMAAKLEKGGADSIIELGVNNTEIVTLLNLSAAETINITNCSDLNCTLNCTFNDTTNETLCVCTTNTSLGCLLNYSLPLYFISDKTMSCPENSTLNCTFNEISNMANCCCSLNNTICVGLSNEAWKFTLNDTFLNNTLNETLNNTLNETLNVTLNGTLNETLNSTSNGTFSIPMVDSLNGTLICTMGENGTINCKLNDTILNETLLNVTTVPILNGTNMTLNDTLKMILDSTLNDTLNNTMNMASNETLNMIVNKTTNMTLNESLNIILNETMNMTLNNSMSYRETMDMILNDTLNMTLEQAYQELLNITVNLTIVEPLIPVNLTLPMYYIPNDTFNCPYENTVYCTFNATDNNTRCCCLTYIRLCYDLNLTFNRGLNDTLNATLNQTLNETLNQTLNATQNETLNSTLNQTMNMILIQALNSTLNQTLNISLNQALNSKLNQTMNMKLINALNETLNKTMNMTLIQALNSTLNQTLNMTLIKTLNAILNKTLNMTLIQALNSTLNNNSNMTLIQALNATLNNTMNMTLIQALNATLNNTMNMTINQTLNATLNNTMNNTQINNMDPNLTNLLLLALNNTKNMTLLNLLNLSINGSLNLTSNNTPNETLYNTLNETLNETQISQNETIYYALNNTKCYVLNNSLTCTFNDTSNATYFDVTNYTLNDSICFAENNTLTCYYNNITENETVLLSNHTFNNTMKNTLCYPMNNKLFCVFNNSEFDSIYNAIDYTWLNETLNYTLFDRYDFNFTGNFSLNDTFNETNMTYTNITLEFVVSDTQLSLHEKMLNNKTLLNDIMNRTKLLSNLKFNKDELAFWKTFDIKSLTINATEKDDVMINNYEGKQFFIERQKNLTNILKRGDLDNYIGEVKIHINYDPKLAQKRKKMEKKHSLSDNVIMIFIDSLSRDHFIRKLPKTSNFIERFIKNVDFELDITMDPIAKPDYLHLEKLRRIVNLTVSQNLHKYINIQKLTQLLTFANETNITKNPYLPEAIILTNLTDYVATIKAVNLSHFKHITEVSNFTALLNACNNLTKPLTSLNFSLLLQYSKLPPEKEQDKREREIEREIYEDDTSFADLKIPEFPNEYFGYQFMKYHNFGSGTKFNAMPMFYGTSIKTEKGRNIIKDFQENGYITAQATDMCSKEVWEPEKEQETLDFGIWDHENIAMFCDPSYIDKNSLYSIFRGVYSMMRRCFYGKEIHDYIFEYGKKFWEAYMDNRKFLRLAFNDAHESSNEVVQYLDEPFYRFLREFYDLGYLQNTTLIITSDHGNNMPGLYSVLFSEDYKIESVLGVLYVISHIANPKGYNKTDIEWAKKFRFFNRYIYENQQAYITAYDIHDTLMHIIYGNTKQFLKVKTPVGESLFNQIDSSKRNCGFYKDWVEAGTCYCDLFTEEEKKKATNKTNPIVYKY